MNSPSSSEKGTQFENEVFSLITKLLKAGKFLVIGKNSKVFQKKGYYSSQRGSDIIFDITIETYLPNSTEYSLLTVIECKNLNTPISVDNIEEFAKKLDQVGNYKAKGIIISSSAFQQGTLNFAKSSGITLARVTNKNKLNWIVYRKDTEKNNSTLVTIEDKLTDLHYSAEPFICLTEAAEVTYFAELLQGFGVFDWFVDNEDLIEIPFVTDHRFHQIIKRFEVNNVYDGFKLDINKTIDVLENAYNVKFILDTDDENYLGRITFEPLEIRISGRARIDANRWRFTIAHEIGHLILHTKYLSGRINEKSDDDNTLDLYFSSASNVERIEVQANMFAGHLLLPESKLRIVVAKLFNEYRIHRGSLFLDNQQVNRDQAYTILRNISNEFEVSIEAVKIKLLKLGLLTDQTRTRIRDVLRATKW